MGSYIRGETVVHDFWYLVKGGGVTRNYFFTFDLFTPSINIH